MNEIQLKHNEIKNDNIKFPIAIVLDNIESGLNVGSIFRVAEGMGVEKIFLCGQTPGIENKSFKKTSRSTENNIQSFQENSTLECISKLKKDNYKIIALEIADASTLLEEHFFWKNTKKIALIVGNENHGISEDVLKHADSIIHIKMHGINTSLNVAVALSISLYEATKQLKQK